MKRRPDHGQPEANGRALPARNPDPEDQTLSDLEQTIADGDQDASDFDQSLADSDQVSSERDQRASDRDQEAADQDEAASELSGTATADHDGYARSRRARSQGAIERDLTSQVRSDTARVRDEAAARRDRLAEERDGAARARDKLADALDAEIERMEADSRSEDGGPLFGMDVLLRAARVRQRASLSRARAAAQRVSAANDRERAARDRRQAARDRAASAAELALEGMDHLTGTLRRRVGLRAIQREVDRTSRTDECLIVAFIDVVGLKAVNDTDGHGAGDDLLREVADGIKKHLRSYDLIARFGGDEFVCSLAGQDFAGVKARFDLISRELGDAEHHATIAVGLAEREEEGSADELIKRADAAMIESRQSRTPRRR